MADFDWKSVVRSVAPSLATALAGPLAGTAASAISEAILGKPDAPEEEIKAVLAHADPELLLKLKQADQQFAQWMGQLEVDLERISAADRSDARTREIATGDRFAKVLAGVIVVGFFSTMIALHLSSPPEGSRSALEIMLGQLSFAFVAVVTYYYGSSVGSKLKTDLFAKFTTKPTP